MGEEKSNDRKGWIATAYSILAAVTVPAWLIALFTAEVWFYILSAAITALCVSAILLSRIAPDSFTRTSPQLISEGKNARVPVLQGRIIATAWYGAIIVPTLAIVWYFFGGSILPSASITEIERSRVRYHSRDNGTTGSFLVPANRFHFSEDDPGVNLYGAIIVTVGRRSGIRSRSVVIQSLRLEVQSVPFDYWQRLHGVNPQNTIMPNRFLAALSPTSNIATAQMLGEDNNPTDGMVVLDEEKPLARMHIQFEGIGGVYHVLPIMEVSDEKGQNRATIKGKKWEHVAIIGDEISDKRR